MRVSTMKNINYEKYHEKYHEKYDEQKESY